MTTEEKNKLVMKYREELNKNKIPFIICALTSEEPVGVMVSLTPDGKSFNMLLHGIFDAVAKESGVKISECAKNFYELEKAFEDWKEGKICQKERLK